MPMNKITTILSETGMFFDKNDTSSVMIKSMQTILSCLPVQHPLLLSNTSMTTKPSRDCSGRWRSATFSCIKPQLAVWVIYTCLMQVILKRLAALLQVRLQDFEFFFGHDTITVVVCALSQGKITT